MSYAPPGESSSDLWLERSYFDGGFLGAVAYGFHCAVFGTCVYFLVRHPSRGSRPVNTYMISFVCVIWAVATINLATGIKWNEMIWIDDRNFPGGPIPFLTTQFSNPVNTLSNVAYVINNFLTDMMVLYRCFVIWSFNYWVIALPFLAIIASTVLSLLTLVQAALPGASLWSHITFTFAVPYWSLSIGINILLTLMIVFRLLSVRNRLQSVLGREHTQTYTSLVAIIVESAAIYSTFSLIYIIAFARNSNIQNLVLPILGQLMCIAPELIIMRVAFGRAFSAETAQSLSGTVRLTTAMEASTNTRVADPNSSAIALGKIPVGEMTSMGTTKVDGNSTPNGSRWDLRTEKDMV